MEICTPTCKGRRRWARGRRSTSCCRSSTGWTTSTRTISCSGTSSWRTFCSIWRERSKSLISAFLSRTSTRMRLPTPTAAVPNTWRLKCSQSISFAIQVGAFLPGRFLRTRNIALLIALRPLPLLRPQKGVNISGHSALVAQVPQICRCQQGGEGLNQGPSGQESKPQDRFFEGDKVNFGAPLVQGAGL